MVFEVLRLLTKDIRVAGLNSAAVLSQRLSAKPVKCLFSTSGIKSSLLICVVLFSSK